MQSPGEPGGSEAAHAIDEGRPVKLLAGPTLVITLPSGLTLQMVELGLALVVPLPKLPYPADPVSCIVPSGIVTKGWVWLRVAASQVAEPQGWKVFPPSREMRPPPRLEPRTAPAELVVPERKAVQELPGNSLVMRVGGANVSLALPLSRVVAKTAIAEDHSTTAHRSVTSMCSAAYYD
jgi:hypothetical protein